MPPRRSRSQTLPSTRQGKRKAVALMEVVSYGTPQKLVAASGQCHRVSPNAKPTHQLRDKQVGIQRSLACNASLSPSQTLPNVDPSTLPLIQGLVKSAVDEALQQECQRLCNMVLADVRNDLGVTLRSLVSDWAKCPAGKQQVILIGNTLNQKYAEKGIYHRVMRGDPFREIKHLLRDLEGGDKQREAATSLLIIVKEAIQESLQMSGDELVSMLASYLDTNHNVHIAWSEEILQQVVDDAKEGKVQSDGDTRNAWINQMASDLANANGWNLNF